MRLTSLLFILLLVGCATYNKLFMRPPEEVAVEKAVEDKEYCRERPIFIDKDDVKRPFETTCWYEAWGGSIVTAVDKTKPQSCKCAGDAYLVVSHSSQVTSSGTINNNIGSTSFGNSTTTVVVKVIKYVP